MIGLVALALVGSGIGKFVGAAEAGETFGNPNAPYILGVVELLIVAALAIPRTRLLGVILAASYFGGAMAFSWLGEGELPLASGIVNTILYLGAALHWPHLTNGSVRTYPAT